jgi:hypothetical protein
VTNREQLDRDATLLGEHTGDGERMIAAGLEVEGHDDRRETGHVGDAAGLESVLESDHVVAWVGRKR